MSENCTDPHAEWPKSLSFVMSVRAIVFFRKRVGGMLATQ